MDGLARDLDDGRKVGLKMDHVRDCPCLVFEVSKRRCFTRFRINNFFVPCFGSALVIVRERALTC